MFWLLFFRRHREGFKVWFRAPARWWERLLAAVASAVVFAIVGIIVRVFAAPLELLPLETLLQSMALSAGLPALLGVFLGGLFPKIMLCIVYPFSLISLDVNAS